MGAFILSCQDVPKKNTTELTSSKTEKMDNSFNQEAVKMTSFTFFQPIEAQLISASLGDNNEILLRYQYQGKNVLVILDKSTKQKKAIITIKKKIDAWN